SFPRQSIHLAGGSSVMPSHHTPPSDVSATFVKIEFVASVAMAFGFVFTEVPCATPKNPASGFIALKRPFASGLIKSVSTPTAQISRVSRKWTMYFSLLHGHGTSLSPCVRGAPIECMHGTTRL